MTELQGWIVIGLLVVIVLELVRRRESPNFLEHTPK
jgi:hypothetical protein